MSSSVPLDLSISHLGLQWGYALFNPRLLTPA